MFELEEDGSFTYLVEINFSDGLFKHFFEYISPL